MANVPGSDGLINMLTGKPVISQQLPPVPDHTFRWATVISNDPLTVLLDGDATPIAAVPDSLTPLIANMRVWVQFYNRRCVVLGAATPAVNPIQGGQWALNDFAQTAASGTFIALNWTGPSDANNLGTQYWSAAQPDRFIAPVSGIYSISGSIVFQANATGYRHVQIRRQNGSIILSVATAATPTNFVSVPFALHEIYIAQGDYLQVHAAQTSGGVLGIGGTGTGISRFSITPIRGGLILAPSPFTQGPLGNIARAEVDTPNVAVSDTPGIAADVAGLEVNFYNPGNRRYRVYMTQQIQATATARVYVLLREGATILRAWQMAAQSPFTMPITRSFYVEVVPTPGVHTYKASFVLVAGGGAATVSHPASPDRPGALSIDDIGPA